MMRAAIVSSLVLFAALSGCVADDAKPSSTTESSATTSPSSESVSPTPTSGSPNATVAPNTPPTANLSSDVPNGTAPLNVTFTIEAEDADGDALNWTLDADGDGTADYNGTELPGEVVHQYLEVGNYTAVLNVTDGTDFASANLTITVQVGGAPLKQDAWVRWDAAGQCHAKDARPAGGPIYINDRPAPGQPYGTGLTGGGGTWIYRETNGVAGLQVGGPDESAEYRECVNPDMLIF